MNYKSILGIGSFDEQRPFDVGELKLLIRKHSGSRLAFGASSEVRVARRDPVCYVHPTIQYAHASGRFVSDPLEDDDLFFRFAQALQEGLVRRRPDMRTYVYSPMDVCRAFLCVTLFGKQKGMALLGKKGILLLPKEEWVGEAEAKIETSDLADYEPAQTLEALFQCMRVAMSLGGKKKGDVNMWALEQLKRRECVFPDDVKMQFLDLVFAYHHPPQSKRDKLVQFVKQ